MNYWWATMKTIKFPLHYFRDIEFIQIHSRPIFTHIFFFFFGGGWSVNIFTHQKNIYIFK